MFSKKTKIYFIARDIKFLTPLREKTQVTEREKVAFEIELSHADVEVNWFKNGAKMARTKNVDLFSEGTKHRMVIHQANMEDYGVEVVAQAEEETSSTNLYINGKFFQPTKFSLMASFNRGYMFMLCLEIEVKIKEDLKDLTIIEKQTAEFMATTNYDTVPHTWYKGKCFLRSPLSVCLNAFVENFIPKPGHHYRYYFHRTVLMFVTLFCR